MLGPYHDYSLPAWICLPIEYHVSNSMVHVFISLYVQALHLQWNSSNQDPWNVATLVFRPLWKVPKLNTNSPLKCGHPCIQAISKSPKACFLTQIHPSWNVATPLIRTPSLVPRVAGSTVFIIAINSLSYSISPVYGKTDCLRTKVRGHMDCLSLHAR